MTENAFEQIQNRLDNSGLSAALDELVDQLRVENKYHDLFEALKMQLRLRLGLPLRHRDDSEIENDAIQTQLEEGLLAACREVGTALMKLGQVRAGWTYLRPLANRSEVANMLTELQVTDENRDEIVELALQEAIDPIRGYKLVLEHYGTCNAITTYQSLMYSEAAAQLPELTGLLVDHVYNELTASIRSDIAARSESSKEESDSEATLSDMINKHPWMTGNGFCHIDVSHLGSTVRFSQSLQNQSQIRKAVEMCEYGDRLDEKLKYPGDDPFTDLFASNRIYLRALIGENIDEALDFFGKRAREVDAYHEGTAPIDVYVGLLKRLGRHEEAIHVFLELNADSGRTDIANRLFELCDRAGDYDRFADFCRQREDLLGFATGLLLSHN